MKTILKEEGHPLALFKSYLALIRGSVGSAQFRRLYIQTPKGHHDVIGDGDLACAFFVSSVLTLFRLTKGGVHTTVAETVLDLQKSGWEEISTFRRGAVLVWESKLCDDKTYHQHIGFALSRERAVSNQANLRSPVSHHITFAPEGSPEYRKVSAIYFHKKLCT